MLPKRGKLPDMEAIEAILSRRSIRRYQPGQIPENIMDGLLKAAMSAPSAGNEQPWHFVVIRDRGILDEIPKCHAYSNMLKQAPVAIAVCGDSEAAEGHQMWVQDCSAATENILIAANAYGLGAVWLAVYMNEPAMEGVRRLLGLPEHIIPFSIVSLGYPSEKKPAANRFDPARVHQNKW
jgi:nitroreductase